jgi:hypothetical protein
VVVGPGDKPVPRHRYGHTNRAASLRLNVVEHASNLRSQGGIRAGHDLATRQRILRDLSQMWARLTGQPEEELLISLWESPAENAMEGGSIFPGIGQER